METPRDATSNPAALEEEVHPEAVCEFVPAVGRRWQGRGLAFPKKPERRLECTLLAYWAEGHEDGWYVLTDLPPQVADAAWYGLRMWIEHGFKQFKSDGWQWQKSRITDPDRAGRVWLAMAVATRWVLSVGGQEDARRGPVETMPAVATRAPEGRTGSAPAATATDPRGSKERPGSPRRISVLRQGLAAVLAALLAGRGVMLGRWYPEAWPQTPACVQVQEHEQNSYTLEKNLPQ